MNSPANRAPIRPVNEPSACCHTCARALNNPADPLSEDCGGDCLSCMAAFGDPECVAAVAALTLQQNKDTAQ